MKSVTIIWCDWGDEDTSRLPELWKNIDAETKMHIVHVTERSEAMEEAVNSAISSESDTLLFCGHGTGYGLLFPNCISTYIIHENNAKLIKAKNVIGLTCYGAEFAQRAGLHGLFTSMFISNYNEAITEGINETSGEQIAESNLKFFAEFSKALSGESSFEECVSRIQALGEQDPVSKFNSEGVQIL